MIYTNFPLNELVYDIESVKFKWGRGLARLSVEQKWEWVHCDAVDEK